MRINFGSKKTEQGWQETIDKFWRDVTPIWFDWLGWVLTLGALTYLQEKTSDQYIQLIINFSYLAIFFYCREKTPAEGRG